jgi:GT2 family glycosyltransferase
MDTSRGRTLTVSTSIIIVNFNGGSQLRACLESLYEFTSDFELIVVDNGSIDGSVEVASKDFPKAILIKNSKNLGFARANNIGIRRAQGQWIVLLNPDTKVTKNWLVALLQLARSSDDIGIVTPKLIRMDGKTIDSTGHRFDFETGYTLDRGSGEPDHGQYEEVEELASCCFACAAIRREVLQHIGLLDEKMILYFEDVDCSIRTRVAGWRVLYCPMSVVFHARGGVSPRSASPMQRRAIAYRLRIILKCYSASNVIRYGSLRVCRDLVATIAGIRNRDIQYSLSYLRSPIWNLSNPPVRERRLVQMTRKVSDDVLKLLR